MRDYLAAEVPFDRIRELDREQRWDEALWEGIARQGWLGLPFPESLAGAGGSLVDAGLLIEEFAQRAAVVPLAECLVVGLVCARFASAGDHNLTVSPAGNPGVIEIDQAFTAAASLLGTWFIAGNPGALTAIVLTNDARIIQGEAKLAVYNGVALFPGLDVYVVLPGTDINTVFATAGLLPGAGVSGLRLEIGDYELTVREAGTANVLAGPQTVSISPEGTYAILLTDNAGGTTVDVTLFDDFN